MVSHTTRSAEHILGCVMAWGQTCPSRIQPSTVCLQCSIAGLIYYDIADCSPSSPKILVRDVSGLGIQSFICFDKNYLYLTLCTVLTSGGMPDSDRKQCLYLCPHAWTYTRNLTLREQTDSSIYIFSKLEHAAESSVCPNLLLARASGFLFGF